MTGLWRYLLYPLPQTSANPARYLSNFLCSNLSNCQCFFYFHDNLQQVCRPANGHKYSTSFLKLDLDFGSKGRAPTLVKHSTPVPKRAQHSCFSFSYPFNFIPCTALLALWLLSHSLDSTEWNSVFQGWDLPHQKLCPWMSTCTSGFLSVHGFFLFIIWWKSLISIHQFISFPCAVSPTEALPVPSALLTQQWQWGAVSQRAPNRLLLWHRLTNQHCLSCES